MRTRSGGVFGCLVILAAVPLRHGIPPPQPKQVQPSVFSVNVMMGEGS